MKPRRTWYSTSVFRLEGGTEDNDLWVDADTDAAGAVILRSTWEPSPTERARIAQGENIELIVWGAEHPPVAMGVVDYPLGAPPRPLRDDTGDQTCA